MLTGQYCLNDPSVLLDFPIDIKQLTMSLTLDDHRRCAVATPQAGSFVDVQILMAYLIG